MRDGLVYAAIEGVEPLLKSIQPPPGILVSFTPLLRVYWRVVREGKPIALIELSVPWLLSGPAFFRSVLR
jgi:hypothetical protein